MPTAANTNQRALRKRRRADDDEYEHFKRCRCQTLHAIHTCLIKRRDAVFDGLRRCALSHFYPESSSIIATTVADIPATRDKTQAAECAPQSWRTLASVWIPSSAWRHNCTFMSDVRDVETGDMYRIMTRLLLRLAELLYNKQSLADECRANVEFWPRPGKSGKLTYGKSCTSGMFADVFAGVSLSLQGRTHAAADDTAHVDIRSATSALELNVSMCDSESRRRGKRQRRRRTSDVRLSKILSAASGDTFDSVSNAALQYLTRGDTAIGAARTWRAGAGAWISTETQTRMRARSAKDVACPLHSIALPMNEFTERRIWNVVLPHVSVPIANLLVRMQHIAAPEDVRLLHDVMSDDDDVDDRFAVCGEEQSISSSSSSSVDASSDLITYERRLDMLRHRLTVICKQLPDEVEEEIRALMLNLYCALCRGVDSNVSTVAQKLHMCRRGDRIDVANEQVLTAYGRTRQHKQSTFAAFDRYRSALMNDIARVVGARADIVSLAQFFLENATCAYNHCADEMTNVVTMGKSGCGKDFLLTLLEDALAPGTVEKISRATEHADAIECRGRDDGLIVYNPEKSVASLYKRQSRGGSGDTITKDRQSSGRIVTRRFRCSAGGRRTSENIVNERYVLEYNAMNPSSILRLDEGIYQRSIWICRPPPTDATQCAILNAAYNNKIAETRKSSQAFITFAHCQRFLQLGAFEVHQMIANGSIRPVVTEAVEFALIYIAHHLSERRKRFGCTASVYRRYKQVVSIAREHSIRRVLVNAFMCHTSALYRKKMTPRRLTSLKYYVSLSDLALALGQVGEHMGIFREGEIQVIMALRYLWITSVERYSMIGNAPLPHYVQFDGSLMDMARRCVQILSCVCPTERNAPRIISLEMAIDTLKRMTCSTSDVDMPPMVSYEDDCVQLTEERERMHKNRRSREDVLVPCVRVDEEARDAARNAQHPQQPLPAVVIRKNRKLHVHVVYLTRLFDPQCRCWPWTGDMPKEWSPQISEHTLLRSGLETLRSYEFQNTPPRIVYKIEYAGRSTRTSHMSATFNVDYVKCRIRLVKRKLKISAPWQDDGRDNDDDDGKNKEEVELHAALDMISMYAASVGWERALFMASDESRWRQVAKSGKLKQCFEDGLNFT